MALFILTSASVLISLFPVYARNGLRAELTRGKRHSSEDTAGIVFLGAYAFLVGNTELRRVYDKLTGARDSDNREESDGHREESSSLLAVLYLKSSIYRAAYSLGNIAAATAALTALGTTSCMGMMR